MSIPRFISIFLFVLATAVPANAYTGHSDAPSVEYRLKAAFILNFAKFTSWPPASDQHSFSIGVVGENPFEDALDPLQEKKIKGQSITIHHFSTVEEAQGAHIVYISKSYGDNLPQVLDILRHTQTLTISDIPGFATSGGGIELTEQNGKLTFIINLKTIRDEMLEIPASLLLLAQEVIR